MKESFKSLTITAPAKINLYLDITGLLDNGYHELLTVMHSIDLADTVTIRENTTGRINVLTSCASIPSGEGNIAFKAAEEFFNETGNKTEGLEVFINKQTPSGAGLGGGSSDAAAVLVGLNELYGNKLSVAKLEEIGCSIGADVPFCIAGGCAVAGGIGEKLTRIAPLDKAHSTFVVVKPDTFVNTGKAFQFYDKHKASLPLRPPAKNIIKAVKSGNIAEVGKNLYNIFECINPLEHTDEIKNLLILNGAVGAVLSGSGSSVVGLFESETLAKKAVDCLKKSYDKTFLANPLPYGANIK